MKRDIYIIKNTINSKVYIGQSKDAAKRWLSHIYNSRYEVKTGNIRQLIHKAMGEYGIDKFHYEILEYQVENHDEREQYWIKFYNSIHPNGYNIAPGGKGCGAGLNSINALIKDEKTLMSIIGEISSSYKTFENIAKKYGCDAEVITAINQGRRYRLPDLQYPLRQTRYSHDLIKQIRYSLKYELELTLKDIANKYHIDLSQLSLINQGHIYYVNGEQYPLRKKRKRDLDSDIVDMIINDIRDSELSLTKIAKKYSISVVSVSGINNGKYYVRHNIKYPIRAASDPRSENPRRCLDITEVEEIHNLLKTEESVNSIAKKYRVSKTMIYNINNGKCKKYVLRDASYPIRHIKNRHPVSTICA